MSDGPRKGRRLSKDEDALWRGVTRSITPLDRKRLKRASEAEEGDAAEPAKPSRIKSPPLSPALPVKRREAPAPTPLDRKLKQKLSRGTQDVDARLDLHGHTQAEAHARLLTFLRRSQEKGASIVLVITGKGMRGDGERGVLRRQVPLWLKLPEFSALVVSFGDAAPAHGGEGALYVRLRRRRG